MESQRLRGHVNHIPRQAYWESQKETRDGKGQKEYLKKS